MTFEATIGLAVSASVALLSGAILIIWRNRIAHWYRNVFNMAGSLGDPFAKAATPRTVAFVGWTAVAIGVFNAARLLIGLLS
ncbi:hypothetical protein ABIC47_001757 [Leifsonia sp. 563]